MSDNGSFQDDNKPFPFLRLPQSIRHRIYRLLNLGKRCPINFEQDRRQWSLLREAYNADFSHGTSNNPSESSIVDWQDWECAYEAAERRPLWIGSPKPGCIHPAIPYQLLQVSRKIRGEVIHILYDLNCIILVRNFSWIWKQDLQFLRRLEVRLTDCSCDPYHQCDGSETRQGTTVCERCHHYCRRGNGALLDLAQAPDQTLVRRWHRFCQSLQQELVTKSDKSFQLVLVCDCKNVTTALKVVEPLMSFPLLKDATIRLGNSGDKVLRNIAEQTVRRLTGSTQISRMAGSSLRLPVEILELIFSYTDLVNPSVSWREILEDPGNELEVYEAGNILRGFREYGDRLGQCCFQCTPSRQVCACPDRHDAYMSTTCKCWKFPAALFLVSRSFNELATKIFLGKNTIVLWEGSSKGTIHRQQGTHFRYLDGPRKFLREMPVRWAEHIRDLTFVFLTYEPTDFLPGSACFRAWEELTGMIKQFPHPEQLTISIDYVSSSVLDEIEFLHDHEVEQTRASIKGLFQLEKPKHYKHLYISLLNYNH